jgi:hypothetical protein
MHQSSEDVVRVFDEFIRGFKSPDLILDSQSAEAKYNANLLLEYVVKKHGWVSITSLQEADQALGVKLYRTPPPKVKTQDQLAAEENARMARDFMASIAPQPSFDAKVAADEAQHQAAEAVKAQEDAKGHLAVAIAGYQCYRMNGAGVDYTATEMVQKELRGVRVGKDFVRTLAVVRQIIQELPDHPKMGDVARVVERLNEAAAAAAELAQPKDSFGSDVKKMGKLGSFR